MHVDGDHRALSGMVVTSRVAVRLQQQQQQQLESRFAGAGLSVLL